MCFDVAQHRQYLVLALIFTGTPLVLTAGWLLRPINKRSRLTTTTRHHLQDPLGVAPG